MKARMLMALMACYCLNVSSSEMSGKFTAGETNVKWQSVAIEDGVAPAYWDTSMRLPPAKELILESKDAISTQTVTLKNGTNSLPAGIEINIMGMQFQLAGDRQPCEGGSDARDGIITLVNNAKSNKICFSKAQTPFTHFRPILDINTQNWDSLFAGKETGRYSGRFDAKFEYDYYRDGVKIRHQVVFPVALKIDYKANEVTILQVEGPDQMLVSYDENGKPTSGRTLYRVKASTHASRGLTLSLKKSRNANATYNLVEQNPASGMAATIPFSVLCDGCNESSLITNGISTSSDSVSVENNDFALEVTFDNLDVDTPNGRYIGEFTLMVKAVL